MWGELRQCLLVHRLPFSSGWVEPYEVMLAATVGGAECLGRDDIGMIAPGMAADLVLVNLEKIGFAGALADPVSAVLFCGDSHIVDTVIVNGVVRVRGGRLVGVDEEKLFAESERVSQKLFRGRPRRVVGRNGRKVLNRRLVR
jgi:8-oxoguanine deaminase